MQQPPRRASERLIDWPLLARAYLWLGLLEAAAAMAAFFFVLGRGGWTYGEMPGPADSLYLRATTACLTAIVVSQVANVFLCRHPRDSLFSTRLFGNRLILWGIAAEIALILAIVYTPWGNLAFGTAPIGAEAWLFAGLFAVAMVALEELRKAVARHLARAATRGLGSE
jgi:magnesium-transporting ATPase (P-type)